MKTIRISQCDIERDIGRYNLCGSEEKLSFYMVIEENGKVIEKDGARARIHYSGDKEDFDDFDRAREDMDLQFLFEKCFSYAGRVWSSINYEADALLFAKEYLDNFEEIAENFSKKEKERINKQIETLKNSLADVGLCDYREEVQDTIKERIDTYNKWIEDNKKEIDQFKDGAEKAQELQKRINGYEEKIKKLSFQS